jgi:hypothetical protein
MVVIREMKYVTQRYGRIINRDFGGTEENNDNLFAVWDRVYSVPHN